MLADLVREVAESRSVTESTIAFIKGLHEQIDTLSKSQLNDDALRAEIARLAAELDAQQANLVAATVVGTVAEPGAPAPDNGIANAPNVETPPPTVEAIVGDATAVEAAQPEPNV